jgi:Kef-type K+ transport system membrane component KefB
MLFNEIAVVVVLAALAGILMIKLKQPSILGYILAGLILTLAGNITVESLTAINSLSSIGIALLLFLVGLEMNPDKLRHLGWNIVLIGLLQTSLSVFLAFIMVKLLGFASIPALYIALALSFSSTIIAIKALSEKKDLASLYGRLVIGVMLVEDFIAILTLIFLSGLAGGASSDIIVDFFTTLFKGFAFLGLTILISRFMPKILELVDTRRETLFLFSLAWGIGMAALAASRFVGLGLEVGGFLAGLALSKSAEHYEIASLLRWLRDFFVVLFFVILGTKMAAGGISGNWGTAAIITLFVVLVNPLITMLTMRLFGYKGRVAFFAGITTAQISEFSLVVMMKGGEIGHLAGKDVSLVTFVAVVSIVVSSYFMIHGEAIYKRFKKFISMVAGYSSLKKIGEQVEKLESHIVLIGADRLGQNVLSALEEIGQKFTVIDFDPHRARRLLKRGINVLCGDATDEEIQETAGFPEAKLIISTAPVFEDNVVIFRSAKRVNPRVKVILTADREWEGRELYKMGADYVVLPHFLGGEHLAAAIKRDRDFKSLEKMKECDLMLLAPAD